MEQYVQRRYKQTFLIEEHHLFMFISLINIVQSKQDESTLLLIL